MRAASSARAGEEGREHGARSLVRMRGARERPAGRSRNVTRLLPAGSKRDVVIQIAAMEPGCGAAAGPGHCRLPRALLPRTADVRSSSRLMSKLMVPSKFSTWISVL